MTETGLLTPAVGAAEHHTGSATVQLTDRNGSRFRAACTVTLTGASSQSATTNSLGCAVFGFIPVGCYNITIPGYVTMASSSPATSTMQVYTGRATFTPMQVERPASLRANFVQPATGDVHRVDAVWDRITVKNTNLVGGDEDVHHGGRTPRASTRPSSIPSSTAWGSTPATCAANDPSLYAPNYFNPPPRAAGPRSARATPCARVNVEMPTLRVTVTRQAVSPRPPSPSRGCARSCWSPADTGTVNPYPSASRPTPASANATAVHSTSALPFGRYTLCAASRPQRTRHDHHRHGTSDRRPHDHRRHPTDDRTGATTLNRGQITITTDPARRPTGVCF